MAQDIELAVRIKAATEHLHAGLRAATRELEGVQGRLRGVRNESQRAGAASEILSGHLLNMARGGHVLAAAFATWKLAAQADEFNTLQQRIKTATAATGDYVNVSARLGEISRDNGAALEASVALFQGLARVRGELRASNEDMLLLTDTVQKLGVIGGSGPAAMQAGLLQFTQAMSAGIVRAEEMNSLLENMPELAVRIARGLGLTPGELRNAVIEGKVLSSEVFAALLRQAPEIAAEFEKIPETLSRAGNALGQSLDAALARLDQSTGFTALLAAGLNNVADRVDAINGNLSPARLATALTAVRQEIELLNKGFYGTGEGRAHMLEQRRAQAADLEDRLRAVNAQRGGLDGLRQRLQEQRDLLRAAESAAADEQARQSQPGRAGRPSDGTVLTRLREQADAARRAVAETGKALELLELGPEGPVKADATRLKALDDLLKRYRSHAQEKADEIRAILAAAAAAGLAADDPKIRDAVARVEAEFDKKAAAEAKTAGRAAAEASRKIEELRELRLSLDTQLQSASGSRLQADLAQAQERLGDTRAKLDELKRHTQVDAADYRLADKIFVQEVFRANLDDARRAWSQTLAGMDAESERVNLLHGAGKITAEDARGQISALQKRAAGELAPLLERQRALAANTPQDEDGRRQLEEAERIIQRLQGTVAQTGWIEGAKSALASYASDAGDSFRNAQQAAQRAFQGMEDALVQFVRTGKFDFKSLADSILADLARIAVRQQITALLDPPGGGAGAFSFLKNLLPFAQGGVFDAPGLAAWRNTVVDKPTLFKFASGGIMGEAGAEAIMPLRRGAGGRLGVDASGMAGGVSIVINEAPGGDRARVSTQPRGDGGIAVLVDMVSGRLARDVASGRGALTDALQSQYAMNRVAGVA